MSELIKKSRWATEDPEEEQKQPEKKQKIEKKLEKKPEKKQEQKEPVPVRKVSPATKLSPYLRECRHVDCFERLNHIEEGSYGVVFRARDKESGEVVALKKLKLQIEAGGFPVTSLREIHALMIIQHPNIVNVREIVMGNHMDQ
jgi:cell division cycle 2-like protein